MENLDPDSCSGMQLFWDAWEVGFLGAWTQIPQHHPRLHAHLSLQDPKATLNHFSFTCSNQGSSSASPIPFRPLPPQLGPRACDSAAKVKVPQGWQQPCSLKQPAGKAYWFIWACWLLPLSLPSYTAWPSRYLSLQTMGCPSGVRTPVPPCISLYDVYTCMPAAPHP